MRELKEQLAQGVAVDMDAYHPLVIGALLKVSRAKLYYSHAPPLDAQLSLDSGSLAAIHLR